MSALDKFNDHLRSCEHCRCQGLLRGKDSLCINGKHLIMDAAASMPAFMSRVHHVTEEM